MPRELSAGEHAANVFGRAERGRAGFHVHIGSEAAEHARAAGAQHLHQREHRQRLGGLLRERAGEGHRAHRAGQRERRDHAWLAVLGHFGEAGEHFFVHHQRRIDIDDGEQARRGAQFVMTDAARDAVDFNRVANALLADGARVPHLVAEHGLRAVKIQMARVGRQIHRLHRRAAAEVQRVQAVSEAN